MEILSTNAEGPLAGLATSIGRDPATWQDWLCLHIDIPDTNLETDCFVWIKSIIESYLPNIEGRAFFCQHKNVYIICKDIAHDNLQQVGELVCDFIQSEQKITAHYHLYDLGQDGSRFSDGFFKAMRVVSSDHDIPENILNRMQELTLFRMLEHTENPASSIGQHTAKVLLVEDDPVTRWMVRSALKHECDFATVSEAHKAFDMYASYQPDIVFLDINLPDANGYDVLQWIMHNDPGATVVMFSSNGNLDNIASSMEQGASGFIAKPFLKEQLLHYIHNHSR